MNKAIARRISQPGQVENLLKQNPVDTKHPANYGTTVKNRFMGSVVSVLKVKRLVPAG